MGNESANEPAQILPIRLEQNILDGQGLISGDPTEFEGEGMTREGEAAPFAMHNFHTGKITVSVYESEPSKVFIDGSPYDEFVYILEGRLILTPQGGSAQEYKQGESLVVPKGYVGHWEMPEKYRELIVIDADYATDQ